MEGCIMIKRIIDFHTKSFRSNDCDLIEWLEQFRYIDDLPLGKERDDIEDEVRENMFQHPGWNIFINIIFLRELEDDEEPRRSRVQAIFVQNIIDAPDSTHKMNVLKMLKGTVKRPSELQANITQAVLKELNAMKERSESIKT